MKKNNANKIKIFALLVFLALRSYAGDFNTGSVGTAGGQFLNMGGGARAISLGGAYTAISDEASGIYWNPAGLVQISDVSLMFMHANYLADISFDYLAFGHKKDNFAFGAALSYMDAGDIKQTDVAGNSIGTYNPRDYVGIISMAMKTNSSFSDDEGFFSIGINAKILKSYIIEQANTFAVDIGILNKSSFGYDKRIRFGLLAQNIGPKIKFDKEEDNLPLTLKGGMAVESNKNLLFCGDVVFPKSNQPYIALGIEYKIQILNKTNISLRFGGNTHALNSLNVLNGLSAGFGVKLDFLSIDYALNGFGELGNAHRVSISFNFGENGNDDSKNLSSNRKSMSSKEARNNKKFKEKKESKVSEEDVWNFLY